MTLHSKFDPIAEIYLKNYFEKNPEFYGEFQRQILRVLGGRTTEGVAIGSGPGTEAIIMAAAGLDTLLTGYDPSQKLHNLGIKLSAKLEEEIREGAVHRTKYHPILGGMETISSPVPGTPIEPASLDYLVLLRAAHEIAKSLGSPKAFFAEIERILPALKLNGVMIIGEPQYNDEITSDPGRYKQIISAVRTHHEARLGHSHPPSDYLTLETMTKNLATLSLQPRMTEIIKDGVVNQVLLAQRLQPDATQFYVGTYERKSN